MQPDSKYQKLEVASTCFPTGSKVCNYKLGSVGRVCSSPQINESGDVIVNVIYEFGKCEENVNFLIPVKDIKKSRNRNERENS